MADALGWRKRIGFVVPSTNTTVQPEVDDLRPRGVTFHLARVSIKERPLTSEQAFLEHVQAMRDGLGSAIEQVMTSAPITCDGRGAGSLLGRRRASQKLEAELAEKAGVGITMGSTATAPRCAPSARRRSRFSRRISPAAMRWCAPGSSNSASTCCASRA